MERCGAGDWAVLLGCCGWNWAGLMERGAGIAYDGGERPSGGAGHALGQ